MKALLARLVAIVALLVVSFSAQARVPVPIIDYPDNPVVTGSGRALTTEQIRDAITAAAQSHSWQISRAPSGDGLQAMLSVSGKHTVVVYITYSAQAYSIMYQSSINMKYSHAEDKALRLIHPHYNRWVGELSEAIHRELSKL